MQVTYKKFENDVIKDIYDVLVEDATRGDMPLKEAQKQAKRFSSKLSLSYGDALKEIYKGYAYGKQTIEAAHDTAVQILFQSFCKENGMPEDAAEYFLNVWEELIEEKTGVFSFIKFSENVLTYYLRAMCYELLETSPDKSKQVLIDEATILTREVQDKSNDVIKSYYEAYKSGAITYVVASDKAIKELLSIYARGKGLTEAKVEQIMEKLISEG